jgi:hypothetical protein
MFTSKVLNTENSNFRCEIWLKEPQPEHVLTMFDCAWREGKKTMYIRGTNDNDDWDVETSWQTENLSKAIEDLAQGRISFFCIGPGPTWNCSVEDLAKEIARLVSQEASRLG